MSVISACAVHSLVPNPVRNRSEQLGDALLDFAIACTNEAIAQVLTASGRVRGLALTSIAAIRASFYALPLTIQTRPFGPSPTPMTCFPSTISVCIATWVLTPTFPLNPTFPLMFVRCKECAQFRLELAALPLAYSNYVHCPPSSFLRTAPPALEPALAATFIGARPHDPDRTLRARTRAGPAVVQRAPLARERVVLAPLTGRGDSSFLELSAGLVAQALPIQLSTLWETPFCVEPDPRLRQMLHVTRGRPAELCKRRATIEVAVKTCGDLNCHLMHAPVQDAPGAHDAVVCGVGPFGYGVGFSKQA
ncbi:uncharacterized protein BXZ73DRAFT_78161 [Epithele typhae]|uniref:uncharacterized protein n=1 Tax=Epithele typhae TaxID=378194 RepID=UPI002007B4EF|nr:uncharacterized protein BXZ73DRAFT_78161 [Epithele typhae]KAH9929631.1 hypothetical protein BXZ73DRAFT_78161 [Epithele typhae]